MGIREEFDAALNALQDRSGRFELEDGFRFVLLTVQFKREVWPTLTDEEREAYKVRARMAKELNDRARKRT